jgi:hypothetical protein
VDVNACKLSKDQRLAVSGGVEYVFVPYAPRRYRPSCCARCAVDDTALPCLPCSPWSRHDNYSGYWKEQT